MNDITIDYVVNFRNDATQMIRKELNTFIISFS